MNCEHFEKLTDRWLSGELLGPTREEFEGHLAACATCSASLAFQRRTSEMMSGRTSPTSAMRFRLASELDNIDSQPTWVLTLTKLGKHTMRKAVWPATAAVMAIGTYAIVAPQGALATSVKNGLRTVKGSAVSDQPNSVYGPTLVDAPRLTTDQQGRSLVLKSGNFLWSDKDLTAEEQELISEIGISIKVEKSDGDEPVIKMKVDYDKTKFIDSEGDKPNQRVLTLKSNRDLRVIIDWTKDKDQIESLRFEKLNNGKWTKFYDQSRKTMNSELDFSFDMKDLGGIDLKLLKDGKFFDKKGELLLKGQLLDLMHLDRIALPLHDLEKELEDLAPEQRAKIEKEMAELHNSIKGAGMHFKMSEQDRKQFKLDMKKFVDDMGKLKLDHKMSDKERAAFEKDMLRMKNELGKLKFELTLPDKDRKAFDLEMKSLKDGLKNESLQFKMNQLGDDIGFSVRNSDGKVSWTIEYDHELFIEKSGERPNETIIESKVEGKRYIVTRSSQGHPMSVEIQIKVDGNWQKQSFLNIQHDQGGYQMNEHVEVL